MSSPPSAPPAPADVFARRRGWVAAFLVLLAVHVAASLVGWHDQGFAGHEFRQAQTAISSYFIAVEHNYGLAYPTPILGKPWSIPMEFPLYEWTVARLVTWFHWPIVETGRGVSLACFYLTLPAWFLLLGSAGLSHARRLAVLMVALVMPVYVFYSRAFMIESLALLAASWHAWFVIRATQTRRPAWLAGAWLCGAAAALAKITTWATLMLPCAAYTLWLMATLRPAGRASGWMPALRVAAWSLAAVLPPLAAGWWWVRAADALKVQNPTAWFLASGPMESFNFGPLALRFTGEFWRQLVAFWDSILLPAVPLAAVLGIALLLRGRWRAPLVLCLAGFLGSQLLFAHLYFAHSYYFYANGFLLAGMVGLAACRILDQANWPRFVRLGIFGAVLAAGAGRYVTDYLPAQRILNPAATGLTQLVQTLTAPDDVIVVFGHDWSAAIPFAARRRALMVPSGTEYETERWARSLALLHDENLTLTLVESSGPGLDPAIRRRLADLCMHPQPVARYHGTMDVYVRRDRLHAVLTTLRGAAFSNTVIPPNRPAPAGEHAFDATRDAAGFIMMSPFPLRYRAPYEVPPWQEYENRPVFLAHPTTELEFAVPAGARTLTLAFGMIAAAYLEHGSDGVELFVESREASGAARELWRRRYNPRDVPADRAEQTVTLDLPAGSTRILVRTGPAASPSYDWVYFSDIEIR
ncbi:MAG: hypothetical protein JSR48_02885 [Verrucomicrobia bacterium]|nr:hypothetical protein [Verrucomicrobiota bacterium]